MASLVRTDDRSRDFTFVRSEGTFFDFQVAACDFCALRIGAGKDALLALDTGLGKTCVVKKVVDDLQLKTLIVTPPGLVYQTYCSMLRYPWELSLQTTARRRSAGQGGSTSVLWAETGAQLHTASSSEHRVLVVNKSLNWLQVLRTGGYGICCVDEAHALSDGCMTDLRRLIPRIPLLLATATPWGSDALQRHFASRAPPDYRRSSPWNVSRGFCRLMRAAFVVRKTARVMELVGTAKVRLNTVSSRLSPIDLAAYYKSLLASVEDAYLLSKVSKAILYLKIEETARRHGVVLEWTAMRDTIRSLLAGCASTLLSLGSESEAREVSKSRRIGARVLECLSGSGKVVDDLGLQQSHREVIFPEVTSADTARFDQKRISRACACCGLSLMEYRWLYSGHNALVPLPDLWKMHTGGFKRSLVRFDSSADVARALEMAAKCTPAGVEVFSLTSSASAAQRRRVIQRFCSFDRALLNLKVFVRGCLRSDDPTIQRLVSGSDVLPRVSLFLHQHRFLLTDRSIDCGIMNLHRFLDTVVCLRVVPSYVSLLQLTGRISRLAVDVASQGRVDVVCHKYGATMDELFQQHVQEHLERAGLGEADGSDSEDGSEHGF